MANLVIADQAMAALGSLLESQFSEEIFLWPKDGEEFVDFLNKIKEGTEDFPVVVLRRLIAEPELVKVETHSSYSHKWTIEVRIFLHDYIEDAESSINAELLYYEWIQGLADMLSDPVNLNLDDQTVINMHDGVTYFEPVVGNLDWFSRFYFGVVFDLQIVQMRKRGGGIYG